MRISRRRNHAQDVQAAETQERRGSERIYWHDSPEMREELELYCCDDTACEREAYRVLPPLSEAEQGIVGI
jgi:hypothetical protein